MKKYLLMMLAMFALPGLVACTPDKNSIENTTTEPTHISTPTSEESLSADIADTTEPNISDYDLFEETYLETVDMVYSYPNEKIGLTNLTPERRIFYIASLYDMEIQNGGLCQFFVNHSDSVAPYVEEALSAIGAESHRQHFADFIADNKIDIHNLNSFRIGDISEYTALTKRYDFDTFDNQYYNMTPLCEYMAKYIRQNADAF